MMLPLLPTYLHLHAATAHLNLPAWPCCCLLLPQVTDVVRDKLHGWDPVLAEYINLHLYGDVYSSPGLSMRQKQLLSSAFLAEAQMHDQLYTHLVAVSRGRGGRRGAQMHDQLALHIPHLGDQGGGVRGHRCTTSSTHTSSQ